ncbi:MAG TPA: hypothetical protein VHL79_07665, partial [Ramlibacter sp.]|nr:hypothetical protein [Ramlibacter sp.]
MAHPYSAGSTLVFQPTDTLSFDAGVTATMVELTEIGASEVRIGYSGHYMTLQGVTLEQLHRATFVFTDGSHLEIGSAGADHFIGSDTADQFVISTGGDDRIDAGAGNDLIVAGGAFNEDLVNAGDGHDTLRLEGSYPQSITLVGVTGTEHIVVDTHGSASLLVQDGNYAGGVYEIHVDGSALAAGESLTVDGSSIASTNRTLRVSGGEGNDTATGGANGDHLSGGTGDDLLSGNAGNDVLAGEAGDDTLYGGIDGDTDQLDGGEGADRLVSQGIASLTGDLLQGNAGNDTLVGGAGNDTLHGGLDADQLTGGDGSDRFRFELGSPRTDSSQTTIDTITDFGTSDLIDLPGTNGMNGKRLVLRGVSAFSSDFTSGNAGVQPDSDAEDGFVDVFWKQNGGRLELWVDGNDDGQYSEVDLFVYLEGVNSLTPANFVDNFVAWKGTAGDDTYPDGSTNAAAANEAYGLGGNDQMWGGGGGDSLYGGLGNDSVYGEQSDDQLYGGDGSDTVVGGSGNDHLYAGGPNSPIGGARDEQFASNLLDGGADNDALYGDAGSDTLLGGDGNDHLDGGAGNDLLLGGDDDGADHLSAGQGADSLDAGGGNDVLFAGASAGERGQFTDTLVGGAGDDVLRTGANMNLASDAVVMTGGLGADRFVFSYGSNAVGDHDAQWNSWYSGNFTGSGDSYGHISSVAAPDRITDFDQAQGDRIHSGIVGGLGGNDNQVPLVWRGHADARFTATSGESTDLARAPGSPRDGRFLEMWVVYDAAKQRTVLYMDRNLDGVVDALDFKLEFDDPTRAIYESIGPGSFTPGTFTVRSGTDGNDSDTSPAMSEDADIAYTFAGNDTIDGLGGHDVINGDAGDDSLTGGTGSDALFGGADADTLAGGSGADTLHGGSGADSLLGGADADVLYAESGNDATSAGTNRADAPGTVNVLDGGAGGDQLHGGDGNDSLLGGDDNDGLYGNNGADTLDGGGGSDNLGGGEGNDLLLGGDGDDGLEGGAGNDTLRGGDDAGSDSLQGTGGADLLEGGAGNDILR